MRLLVTTLVASFIATSVSAQEPLLFTARQLEDAQARSRARN